MQVTNKNKSVNITESSEKMPPYPGIFKDDFQMSDQMKLRHFNKTMDNIALLIFLSGRSNNKLLRIAYMKTTGKMYNV